MKYSKIVADVSNKLNLKLSPEEARRIVSRLELTKANFKDFPEWAEVVDNLTTSLRSDPLNHEVKTKRAAMNKVCAVCSMEGREITLMGGRKAYYCHTHRVVMPALSED